MPAEINKEFAATILIEAAYTNDRATCEKYDISERTLRRYRQAIAKDEVLAAFVRTKKIAIDNLWAEELRFTLNKGIRVLSECFESVSADPQFKKNPVVIQSIADAIRQCADVELTGKLIDARTAPPDRPQDSIPGQGDSETAKPLVN